MIYTVEGDLTEIANEEDDYFWCINGHKLRDVAADLLSPKRWHSNGVECIAEYGPVRITIETEEKP